MGGGVRAAGVGSGVTGIGADLIVIDDPVKSREEVRSVTYRERVWQWYKNDMYTRLEPNATIVLIMTRWHQDDLAGRLKSSADAANWIELILPAEAEENDPLGRELGEPLWPERYGMESLAEIRTVLGNSFHALYQQRPVPREGEMFRRPWFKLIQAGPARADRTRYWDKAGTAGGGDFSCGVLISRTSEGLFYVEDVIRGQWSAGEREKVILQTAGLDRRNYGRVTNVIEQEPGSAGKESAKATIRNLAGYIVKADRVTGNKITRAEPFAAQCEAGNVFLVNGSWNAAFLDELTTFPFGKFNDQVDASSGAFNQPSNNYGDFLRKALEKPSKPSIEEIKARIDRAYGRQLLDD